MDVLCFENLKRFDHLAHLVTRRTQGVSPAPYDSLNLALHVGDDSARVIANRQRVAERIGVPLDRFVFAQQVHGNHVAAVTRKDAGRGALDVKTAIAGADALITDQPNLVLTVLVADCVPILFYDPAHRAIGVAHAGWRGTVANIAAATVDALSKNYHTNPEDLLVGLGPAIGPCCYDVGPNVIDAASAAFGPSTPTLSMRNSRTYFDLWTANKFQLIATGVDEEHIEIMHTCTSDHTDTFFSHRAGNLTGRFAAGIMLR